MVFCADDLGVSVGANAGVARAVRAGLVREASFCVTGAAAEEGAELAHALGDRLRVGLHLSFTLGRALTGPIRGLTDRSGRFHALRRVLAACLRRGVDFAAVRAEVVAQLERLRGLDLAPSHLNGHHHVHCFPVVRDAVVEVACTEGIVWTRAPAETGPGAARTSPARAVTAWLARGYALRARRAGLRFLPFLGFSLRARRDYRGRALAVAERLAPGTYEWMVHPREPDPAFAELDRLGAGDAAGVRAELEALADPGFAAALRARGVAPASFADLGGAAGTME